MAEPHDEIEAWLGREVEPLPPPPGTFARIQRRARRRKLHQALTTAAGAVVIIAGAVLVPTVAPGLLNGGGNGHGRQPPAGVSTSQVSPRTSPSRARSTPASSPPSPRTSQPPTGTALSRTTSGAAPPAHFRPTSITMISANVGAVIGQAGTPGHCSGPVPADCTSLAGTSSYGASWYGVSAPVTGAPAGSTGVGQVRFLDLSHGWAFGPELWATSDGGRNWAREPTFGLRVTDLETAGNRVFAVLASCQGNGAAYAADCSTFALYSSLKDSTTLRKVPLVIPAKLRAGTTGSAGLAASASLVLTGGQRGGTGYLLAPTGAVLSGPLTGSAWTYVGKAPCSPGPAAAGGSPVGAQLAAGGGGKLMLNCAASKGGSASGGPVAATGARQAKTLWVSSSSGARWRPVSKPPAAGRAAALATTSQGQVILATSAGIDYSPDGTKWQPAKISGGPPAGGFSYLGMTTAQQGVAVPADAALGEVFVTADGGQTWSRSRIAG